MRTRRAVAALALAMAAGTGAAAQDAAAPQGLRGMVTYFADSPRFADCASGRDLPIAFERDLPALQAAVLEGRVDPETPILAVIEGRIEDRPRMEGAGLEPAVIVDRFVAAWPAGTCADAADAPLAGAAWRILRLGAERLPPVEPGRAAELTLLADGSFAASVGCNRMMGDYALDGAALRFGPAASTMMACPPPLDAAERALAAALEATRSARVNGPALELLDAEGAPLALLAAPAR